LDVEVLQIEPLRQTYDVAGRAEQARIDALAAVSGELRWSRRELDELGVEPSFLEQFQVAGGVEEHGVVGLPCEPDLDRRLGGRIGDGAAEQGEADDQLCHAISSYASRECST